MAKDEQPSIVGEPSYVEFMRESTDFDDGGDESDEPDIVGSRGGLARIDRIPAELGVQVEFTHWFWLRFRLFCCLMQRASWAWPGPIVITLDVDEEQS